MGWWFRLNIIPLTGLFIVPYQPVSYLNELSPASITDHSGNSYNHKHSPQVVQCRSILHVALFLMCAHYIEVCPGTLHY